MSDVTEEESEFLFHTGKPTWLELVAADKKHAGMQPCGYLHNIPYENTHNPGHQVFLPQVYVMLHYPWQWLLST
jgi:hypothetical protein